MDLPALQAVAKALLPVYRRRRRLRALQTALDEPADVQRAYDLLEDVDLPWLRGSLDPEPQSWPWGIEAARRVHHLAIDVTRTIPLGASSETRRVVLEEHARIDRRLGRLEERFTESRGMLESALERLLDGTPADVAFGALAGRVTADGPEIAGDLADTAEGLLRVLVLGDERALEVRRGLFGDDVAEPAELTDELHRTFLRRVIAVDVARRSFLDDDTLQNPQQISFAQLTPEAPDPIFAERPFSEPRHPSPENKLCGVILWHFGAFYRRSWRANDFMWGRLDASARIVEMMVGAQRSQHLQQADDHEPWQVLAAALCQAGAAQQALLEEALDDLPAPAGSQDRPLEDRLAEVFRGDLQGQTRGEITRTICRRAAQFEILCEELRHVVSEAENDLKLGCTPATLGLDGLNLADEDGVLEAVRRLRESKCVLPKALGRGSPQEKTSDLAARVVAHASLVGLSVSRGAGGPLVSPVTTLRSAMLPVAGAVSPHVRNRLGVVAAFSGAALYLGARIAATTPARVVNAGELSFTELLLAVVALLVVLGTAALPAARTILGRGWRQVVWGVTTLLLLAVGGIGAGAVATLAGPLTWAHLLVAPGVHPPTYVTALPLLLGAGAAVVGPRPLRKPIAELGAPTWRGTWSLLLVGIAVAIMAIWAAGPIGDAIHNGYWWQRTAGVLAVAAIPVSLIAVIVLAPRLAAGRRRPLTPQRSPASSG
jgi:hypothetical protein